MLLPRRFHRRGAVGVMAAIAGVMLLAFGGLGVDLERVWLVRGRLQTALDTAGLAAARNYAQSSCTTTCTDANAVALFWAEFGRNNDINASGGTGFMAATATSPVFTPIDSSHLQITATATVPVIMLGVVNLYGLSPHSVTMSVSTIVQRAGTGLEVSLVLDDTYSMSYSDGSTSQTKIQALQSAVATLLNTLYGTDANGNPNDTIPGLNVAVVPFTTGINVGSANIGFVASSPTYAPSNWQNYWIGCVEARANGGDVTETNPYSAPFQPYFWPNTYNLYGDKTCASGNGGYYSASPNICFGDNDWGNTSAAEAQNPISETGVEFGSQRMAPSPNASCPTTPILPLTASRTTVSNTVNAMTAPPDIGTIIGLGLQGGWFTLSPSWRGSTGWGNATLPQNYASSSSPPNPPIQKVIVLLSDGGSDWLGDYEAGPADEYNGKADMFYMAYGRPTRGQIGVSLTATGNPYNDEQTNATTLDAALDSRWSQTCTNIKATGIIIFVIGLDPASSDVSKLQSCATDSAHYISSPTAASLQAAFQNVGNQLVSLTITQ